MEGLPSVSFSLKNLQTGEWMQVDGGFDPGSDITNLPIDYASRLGVDVYREEKVEVNTVGGKITGYVANMQMRVGETTFNAPVLFREGDTTGPLLGTYPLSNYFNFVYDNASGMVSLVARTPSEASSIYNLKMLALSIGKYLRRYVGR